MNLTRRNLVLGGLAVAFALGAIFAFLGVYDTNRLAFLTRFVFWTTTFVVGNTVTALIAPWVINDLLRERSPVFQIVLLAAVTSFPVTLVLAAFQTGFARLWPLKVWAIQYGYVIIISLITITISYLVLKAFGHIGAEDGQAEAGPCPKTRFMQRLPVRYRGASLYAVSAEDHYLRVHTDRGEELILMRLSDALRELEGADGVQTHRSWWVARDGVTGASRENGKLTLTLKSGALAPVSRSFAKKANEQLLKTA